MPAATLGKDGKLWYKEGGQGSVNNWTELTNVKDVTLNGETGEADASTRSSGGWRQTLATLRDGSVEFEMLWSPGDAGITAIKDAWLANGIIGLQILDGEPGEGLQGDFMVTNFSRGEPLEEGMTVSATLKLAPSDDAPAWVENVTHP